MHSTQPYYLTLTKEKEKKEFAVLRGMGQVKSKVRTTNFGQANFPLFNELVGPLMKWPSGTRSQKMADLQGYLSQNARAQDDFNVSGIVLQQKHTPPCVLCSHSASSIEVFDVLSMLVYGKLTLLKYFGSTSLLLKSDGDVKHTVYNCHFSTVVFISCIKKKAISDFSVGSIVK